jgi:DNA-binding response OmpR family regulator
MTPKLLFIGLQSEYTNELKVHLSTHFESVFLKTDHAYMDVVQSWNPHVIIFFDQKECEAIFRNTMQYYQLKRPELWPGLVILAPEYSLHDENQYYTLGCDMYLLAKTPMTSLCHRLTALSRRVHQLHAQWAHLPKIYELPTGDLLRSHEHIEIDNIRINLIEGTTEHNKKLVNLTPIQQKLLVIFMSNPNTLFERKELKQMIWGDDDVSFRTVDAHIAKLKKALPALEDKIVNLYGRGYRFVNSNTKAA